MDFEALRAFREVHPEIFLYHIFSCRCYNVRKSIAYHDMKGDFLMGYMAKERKPL